MTSPIIHTASPDGKEHVCVTIGSSKPNDFRLAKTPDGELFLQGRFTSECVMCGLTNESWIDLPTFSLPAAPKSARWQNFRKFLSKVFSFSF